MLDRDLARLYDVSTAALNQAVRRNRDWLHVSVDDEGGGSIKPITNCDWFREEI